MVVTVYTKPQCVQCNMTYRALDAKGISYTKVDITEDAQALEMVKSLGYMQAPVVIAGDEHWSGFQPDKINALAAKQPSRNPHKRESARNSHRHTRIRSTH